MLKLFKDLKQIKIEKMAKKAEYDKLIINYRVISGDLSTNEEEIVNKSLRLQNAVVALDFKPEQMIKLIKKITKGEIKL